MRPVITGLLHSAMHGLTVFIDTLQYAVGMMCQDEQDFAINRLD